VRFNHRYHAFNEGSEQVRLRVGVVVLHEL
jgi:hypothetical protein